MKYHVIVYWKDGAITTHTLDSNSTLNVALYDITYYHSQRLVKIEIISIPV